MYNSQFYLFFMNKVSYLWLIGPLYVSVSILLIKPEGTLTVKEMEIKTTALSMQRWLQHDRRSLVLVRMHRNQKRVDCGQNTVATVH